MKKNERRALFIFTACFIIFALCLLAIYIELNQHKANLINAYENEQQTLATQTAFSAGLILNGFGGKTGSEDQVVSQLLTKNDLTSSRYYIFAGENGIIYLRNQSVTTEFKGLTVRQAFQKYRSSSGNMTKLFNALDLHENQTVSFTFSADQAKQYFSLSFFTAGGHSYLIGLCSSEDYVITQDQVLAHYLSMYLYCGALCVLFFGMSVLYILRLIGSGNLIEALRKDIRSKNVLLQYLTTTDAQGEYLDKQTGVYNHDFFMKLLAGSHQKKLMPVCIAVIHVSKNGKPLDQKEMDIVTHVLMGVVSAERIAARTDTDEFSMIMLGHRTMKASRLVRSLGEELELHQIRADYGIALLKTVKQDPEEVFQKAHSIMYYQTLLDHDIV